MKKINDLRSIEAGKKIISDGKFSFTTLLGTSVSGTIGRWDGFWPFKNTVGYSIPFAKALSLKFANGVKFSYDFSDFIVDLFDEEEDI